MISPFDVLQIVMGIRRRASKRYTGTSLYHRLMRFFFANYLGMIFPGIVAGYILYQIAPVWIHHYLFEVTILNAPGWVVGAACLILFIRLLRRYILRGSGFRGLLNPIVITGILACALLTVLTSVFIMGAVWVQMYRDAPFAEVHEMPQVSNELIRYTPAQVAAEEIVRRTQTSEFTPGHTRPIGSTHGVAYIAPLVPQGFWNALSEQNHVFLYFNDGGNQENAQRVETLSTGNFQWGEGMEFFDDIYRKLIWEVGFFNTYPEIYYSPIFGEDGSLKDVVGVVPYISYRFWWGILVPKWGGVAIFRSDGHVVDLTPEQAMADPDLQGTQRLFPEKLAHDYIHAQRYDNSDSMLMQMWNGLVQRPGKIEIPRLPGTEQMPFFLPMQDGTYQYLATVEPDGKAYSLMRIYAINAKTGERTVYRYDVEGRPSNLQGPSKVISYAKSLPNYVWYEGEGKDASGTYRIVEPRPVTPLGQDHLFWMLSITPKDYARVVATVFVDPKTNEVHGPFESREETFAWLQGRAIETTTCTHEKFDNDAVLLSQVCEDLESLWHTRCNSTTETTAP